MAEYTFTIFDADPQTSTGTAWPDFTDEPLEAETDEDAADQASNIMANEAEGLHAGDGYDVGQKLYAIVRDPDGVIVAQPTYTITAEDLAEGK